MKNLFKKYFNLYDLNAELYEVRQQCIVLSREVLEGAEETNKLKATVAALEERVENALNASYVAYDPIISQISELREAHVALNNTVVENTIVDGATKSEVGALALLIGQYRNAFVASPDNLIDFKVRLDQLEKSLTNLNQSSEEDHWS